MSTQIFLTGATGYIGGAVLALLLDHPLAKDLKLSALVRVAEKAKLLEELSVRAVIGSHADHDLLTSEAAKSDIVFACADSDDLGAAKAILAGTRIYHERTGKQASLIHTSGTGVLSVFAHGNYASDTIFSDFDIPLIETLSVEPPHRKIDLTLVQADREGYVNTYIVLPSTIYGRAKGLLVDKGIQKPYSIQIPELVRINLARGQAGAIGKGENLWPDVHIEEVAQLYIILFDLILKGPDDPNVPIEFEHGRSGFYFGENGEHKRWDVYKAAAVAMHNLGIGSEEPTSFTEEEMAKYFPDGDRTNLSTNSRCKADRGRAIGWKPTRTSKDMLESIEEEVKAFAA